MRSAIKDRIRTYLGKSKTRRYAIGVIGYSDKKFNEAHAKGLIDVGLRSLIKDLGQPIKNIEIVSGLTALGIPLLAYKWATRKGIRTVGIACKKAEDYDCFDVDERIIHGDEWGAESKIFLDRCDALLRVGGGKQSMAEALEFKKTGKPLFELELAERKPHHDK
jgi:predicted Rossmann-fold nucleotide-binding protein